MTDPKPPELFSQRPAHMEFVHEEFARREAARVRSYRIRRIITCVVLAIILGGGGYTLYTWKEAPSEIPTIKAEASYKQKPEQPGGIDIPNQDVLAYQQMDNSNTPPPAAEKLMPLPETPQAAPPATPASASTLPTAPVVENLALPPVPSEPATKKASPDIAPPPSPPASDAAQDKAEPPPVVIEAKPETAPALAPKADTRPAPEEKAEKPAKATSGRKGYRVQLASIPDKEMAGHEMGKMQQKYADALGDAELHLARADLGARGIYYRVQSNPITDGEARDICAALKKLKAGCIVVKP